MAVISAMTATTQATRVAALFTSGPRTPIPGRRRLRAPGQNQAGRTLVIPSRPVGHHDADGQNNNQAGEPVAFHGQSRPSTIKMTKIRMATAMPAMIQ